jgi:NNP family nitrate/nitrite transporter-like MFS transporter
MGVVLFPLFTVIYGGNREMAWRTVCIVPAAIAFITGILIYKYGSDDAPKGNYVELKRYGIFRNVTVHGSFYSACMKSSTWLLFIQYACCFGVELTMTNAASMYFMDRFGQSSEAAGAIASIFGWLNLFARGLGGFVSDAANNKFGMRGRLYTQAVCLFGEGVMVLIFASTNTLGSSIVCLIIFSLFVQAADGTSFAIVPYVDPRHMGSVIGIVGAGGNVGAVCFGLAFRELSYSKAFMIMGCCILGSSLLTMFISIPGYASLFNGRDLRVSRETGEIMSTGKDHSSRSGGSGSKASGAII